MREFITGNQAVVRGALKAGCDFFAGYPITPASSILSEFVRAFASGRGVAIQTEDEIAAIAQCIGASMAGAKAITASSGPGLSLYSENIGLAQMGEVPLVIVDCQRMGPATGGATATGEGDVLFARHVTAGGYPLPVVAATDATTAYWLTYEACNIAERLRTPVIVLLSKDIALMKQTVDFGAVALSPVVSRCVPSNGDPFEPYAVDAPEDVPLFAPIGGERLTRFTGSIHDENGVLTIDRTKIDAALTHLRRKIEAAERMLEFVEEDVDPGAKTLIVSYGLADGAARAAVQRLRDSGQSVSHLTLYSLWPIPMRALRRAATESLERVVIPELNIGLYCSEVQKVLPHVQIESITRYDGGLISPRRIIETVEAGTGRETTACRP